MKNGKQLTLEEQFEIVKDKFSDSTSTVDELRHAVFAPVNNITHNSKTAIELKANKKISRFTNWGKITIEKTVLTQKHKDLFDCIITYADFLTLKNEPGTIAYAFSGQDMNKKYYGEDTKTKNLSQLDKMLTDMLSAVISIEANNGDKVKFQIFSFAGYSEEHQSYVVKINHDYARFFASCLTINYSEELQDILKIDDPIIKAIVRLALTQKSTLSMKIHDPSAPRGRTGILEAIGFPIESPSQEKRAYKVLKDYVETLRHFGVHYNPNDKSTIRYKKKLDIRFIPPAEHKALIGKGVNEEDYYVKMQDFIGERFFKNDIEFEIKEIFLDIDKDKIILTCFNISDIKKEVKTMELHNMPSQAYDWLEKQIIRG